MPGVPLVNLYLSAAAAVVSSSRSRGPASAGSASPLDCRNGVSGLESVLPDARSPLRRMLSSCWLPPPSGSTSTRKVNRAEFVPPRPSILPTPLNVARVDLNSAHRCAMLLKGNEIVVVVDDLLGRTMVSLWEPLLRGLLARLCACEESDDICSAITSHLTHKRAQTLATRSGFNGPSTP